MRKIILFILMSVLAFTGCTSASSISEEPSPTISENVTELPTGESPEPTKALTTTPIVTSVITQSIKPTLAPSAPMTATPKAEPTKKPIDTVTTVVPTRKPTATPTKKPTATPTAVPTKKPTPKATKKPTAVPTNKPTPVPTVKSTVPVEQFKQYNSDLGNVLTVNGQLEYLYESLDILNNKYGLSYQWSKECEDRARAVVLGESPKEGGIREQEFKAISDFTLSRLVESCYNWGDFELYNYTGFAMVRIEFTDTWNDKEYRYVCVVR